MHNQWNHQSVKANGLQLHFVREGEGTPLLMIHGWPGIWYDWSKQLPVLSQHFDCIALDMRGFGHSDKPELPPEMGYNDGSMAADILEVINELGLAKVGLIGHNFGCLWAQRFVRSHPERVSKLALFNPPYMGIGQRWREPQHGPQFWYQYFHNLEWSGAMVSATPESIRAYITYFLKDRPIKKAEAFTDEDMDVYVESYSLPGAIESGFKVFRSAFRGGNQIVLPEEKIIAHETLILWGEDDLCVPIRWSDRLGEYFSNYHFHRIAQCGHYPMRECPEKTNEYLIKFFAEDD